MTDLAKLGKEQQNQEQAQEGNRESVVQQIRAQKESQQQESLAARIANQKACNEKAGRS